MSFLLPCPNCGPRDVNEFSYAGEVTKRPNFRENVAGIQREWWYHRLGCEVWFQAERDTRTNEVIRVEIPSASPREGIAAHGVTETPDMPAV